MDNADLQSEYASSEYYDTEHAGKCEECGAPLEIQHEPNGDSDYNVIGFCRKCDIYYG